MFNPLLLNLKAIRKYKNIKKAIRIRHKVYNQQTRFVFEQEALGNCFVILPPKSLNIPHTEHNENKLKKVYEIGRKVAQERLEDLKRFIAEKTTK